MSCVPAVLDVSSRMTYRSGEVSITTFDCGKKKMGLGNGFMTGFAATFVKVWVVLVKPVRASSTANRSKPRKKGGFEDKMRGSKEKGENGIFWSIRLVCWWWYTQPRSKTEMGQR